MWGEGVRGEEPRAEVLLLMHLSLMGLQISIPLPPLLTHQPHTELLILPFSGPYWDELHQDCVTHEEQFLTPWICHFCTYSPTASCTIISVSYRVGKTLKPSAAAY